MGERFIKKTYQFQFEISVEVEESSLKTGERESFPQPDRLDIRMLSAAIARLQEYSDYLIDLDANAQLLRAIQAEKDRSTEDGLSPVPVPSIHPNIQVEEARIYEIDFPYKRLVWRDLLPVTRLGQLLQGFGLPASTMTLIPRHSGLHYFSTRGLTQDPTGIHAQGICSCGALLIASAETESDALESLWHAYKKHASQQERIHSSLPDWKRLFRRSPGLD